MQCSRHTAFGAQSPLRSTPPGATRCAVLRGAALQSAELTTTTGLKYGTPTSTTTELAVS
jgi:hypothetical protein